MNEKLVKELRGKVVLSDFPELIKTCYIQGIMHVLVSSQNTIPNEKIDCIILEGRRNKLLESEIINKKLYIPIVYLEPANYMIWCGWCGSCDTTYVPTTHISKYCSEKCMNINMGLFREDGIKSLVGGIYGNETSHGLIEKIIDGRPVIEFERSNKKTTSDAKKAIDKFQNSVIKDAIRLEYAYKREHYKKEMKQLSFRKNTKAVIGGHGITKICKGVTKKGSRCTNKVIGNSDFCGILSHSMAEGMLVSSMGIDSEGVIDSGGVIDSEGVIELELDTVPE
jgi:hypothetical protein